MLQTLIDRIQKLFAVKSIITLAATGVFCALCLKEMISTDQFMVIYTMIIGFYFGTQAEKKNAEKAIQVIEDADTVKPEEAELL